MKAIIRSISALAMLAFSAPAIAGGVNVYDDGDSKLKLGGKAFIDATQTETKDQTGVKSASTTGFNLGRAYLTAKYTFNSDWMMRITTDVATETKAGLGKTTNVFLKYAYLQGKLMDDAAVLRLGVSHNPWIDYEQGLWKHRYFTKVTSDEFKYDDSADIGVGLKGSVADGLIKYWATAVNGGGYGNLTKTDGTDFKTRIGLYPVKGLTIDVGYNQGYRGKKTFTATGVSKQTMYQVMASYGTKDFRIGGNWIRNKDAANKLVNTKTYAAWGWAKVGNGFGVVGRVEQEKSDKLNTAGTIITTVKQKRARVALGLDYSPVKNVTFTAGWIQDKTTNSGNTVGITKKTTQLGMWSQIKY